MVALALGLLIYTYHVEGWPSKDYVHIDGAVFHGAVLKQDCQNLTSGDIMLSKAPLKSMGPLACGDGPDAVKNLSKLLFLRWITFGLRPRLTVQVGSRGGRFCFSDCFIYACNNV